MNLAKATRRFRNTRGASYLTHGDDNHDHKGLNKARRALDQAIIEEGKDDTSVAAGETLLGQGPFRLVLTTQIYENYGTHNCDCGDSCDCPPYWKAKGGAEYHHPIGDTDAVLVLGAEGLRQLALKIGSKVSRFDRHIDEYVINWGIFGADEETFEEQMLREMLDEGYLTKEQYEHRTGRFLV